MHHHGRIDLQSRLTGGFCGLWAAIFLVQEPRASLLAVPFCVVGVALLRRSPVGGALLVLVANVICVMAGVAYGNVEMVVAIAFASFTLGRRVDAGWAGPAIVGTLAVSSALRDELTVSTLLVPFVVFGAPYVYGRIVRHRAVQAGRAVVWAERLARVDPDRIGARLAMQERARLTREAVTSLRGAVVGMRDAATAALDDLDPATIGRIRQRGDRAIHELHEALGLLRREEPAPTAVTTAAVPATRTLVCLRDDAMAALAVGGLGVAFMALGPTTWDAAMPAVALHVAVLPAIALRRVAPALACLLAALASAVVALHAPTDPNLLLPVSGSYALLAWSVADRPAARVRGAFALLVLAGMAIAAPFGLGAVGYIAVTFAGPALSRRAWHERDRMLREAEEHGRTLQASLARTARLAVQQERRRVARDLHDVTSHAVGVMVLQAGAAEALRPTSAQRARDALRTVVSAGSDALAELDTLFRVLDVAALDPAADGSQLRQVLDVLVERMAGTGLTVTADLRRLPASPALAETVLRVVQEGLTNAARHAPAARVHVTVDATDDSHVVCVRDDGGSGATDGASPGFGLLGMAERVHACGGDFTAGHRPGGGFEVVARLPADAAPDALTASWRLGLSVSPA